MIDRTPKSRSSRDNREDRKYNRKVANAWRWKMRRRSRFSFVD